MRRSGVRAATVALLITALGAGGCALAGPASASRPVGYAGPARGLVTLRRGATDESGTSTSRNWDGYVTYASTEGTDFTAIKSTWVQPAVTCEAANAWTVFWVGLDGWFDGTVEQGGSSAVCANKGGPAQYQLWWEMYPTNSIQTVLLIKAGDTVTASVTYSASVFTIKVRDVTSGDGFTRKERCASGLTCDRNSTEVITEDVGSYPAGTYFPLADYGTMDYTGISATDVAGHSGSISAKHWLNTAITESAGGVTYATVSKLRNQGRAFSTTWKHR